MSTSTVLSLLPPAAAMIVAVRPASSAQGGAAVGCNTCRSKRHNKAGDHAAVAGMLNTLSARVTWPAIEPCWQQGESFGVCVQQ